MQNNINTYFWGLLLAEMTRGAQHTRAVVAGVSTDVFLEPIKSSWLLVFFFFVCVEKIPPVSNCPAFPHDDRAVSPRRRNVFKVL